jgi:hypothetical protein
MMEGEASGFPKGRTLPKEMYRCPYIHENLLTSGTIGKMQTKTNMRQHFIVTKMSNIKKTSITKCWSKLKTQTHLTSSSAGPDDIKVHVRGWYCTPTAPPKSVQRGQDTALASVWGPHIFKTL